MKSVKPRARKVASTPLRLLRVQRVKLEGSGLHVHVSSISPERGRKVSLKINRLRQRELV